MPRPPPAWETPARAPCRAPAGSSRSTAGWAVACPPAACHSLRRPAASKKGLKSLIPAPPAAAWRGPAAAPRLRLRGDVPAGGPGRGPHRRWPIPAGRAWSRVPLRRAIPRVAPVGPVRPPLVCGRSALPRGGCVADHVCEAALVATVAPLPACAALAQQSGAWC